MARRRTAQDARTAPTGTARVAALRLLGRRDYTTEELRTRLIARGFSPDDVARALEALVADGLADDRRAARTHIRTGSRVKGRGRRRLRQELDRRGLSAEIATEALAEHSDDDELAALRRVLARRRVKGRLSMAERRRLFQQLLRRGFAPDVIARALGGAEPADD